MPLAVVKVEVMAAGAPENVINESKFSRTRDECQHEMVNKSHKIRQIADYFILN